MSHDVVGTRQHFCDLDPKVKVKGKKVYLRWCTIDCCSSVEVEKIQFFHYKSSIIITV